MHTPNSPAEGRVEEIDLLDEDLGAGLETDYWRDLAMTEPDQPGGRIVFSTGDYETEEEAEAALDAYFENIIARCHEDASKT
jgi:hypothetical protein